MDEAAAIVGRPFWPPMDVAAKIAALQMIPACCR